MTQLFICSCAVEVFPIVEREWTMTERNVEVMEEVVMVVEEEKKEEGVEGGEECGAVGVGGGGEVEVGIGGCENRRGVDAVGEVKEGYEGGGNDAVEQVSGVGGGVDEGDGTEMELSCEGEGAAVVLGDADASGDGEESFSEEVGEGGDGGTERGAELREGAEMEVNGEDEKTAVVVNDAVTSEVVDCGEVKVEGREEERKGDERGGGRGRGGTRTNGEVGLTNGVLEEDNVEGKRRRRREGANGEDMEVGTEKSEEVGGGLSKAVDEEGNKSGGKTSADAETRTRVGGGGGGGRGGERTTEVSRESSGSGRRKKENSGPRYVKKNSYTLQCNPKIPVFQSASRLDVIKPTL